MKKLIFISAAFLMLVFGACKNSTEPASQGGDSATQNFSLDTTKLEAGSAYYQCEMDPEIISDKPGNCPKCGMELQKLEKK